MKMDVPNRHLAESELDRIIARWLRTSKPDPLIADINQQTLLHRIDLHGVGPMLALHAHDEELPTALATALRQRLVASELWEAQHVRLLEDALSTLSSIDVQPMILKGTALAYSHYPRPSTRPRGDSDILVPEAKREQALCALETAGFRQVPDAGGDIVKSEVLFQKEDLAGIQHDFDVHWRVNSSAFIQKLFTEDELFHRSVSAPELGSGARRMGNLDALLFACVHRRLHIDGDTHIYLNDDAYPVIDRLIWLFDIHVLFGTLEHADMRALLQMARDKGLFPVLNEALQSAQARLGTDIPEWVKVELETQEDDLPGRYLCASPARKLTMNFIATEGLIRKAAFLRELIFPPPDYMRTRFVQGRYDWLPMLYWRRVRSGIRKLFVRRNPTS